MAALGYAATGYGQGALQQRQVNRDEQYRQQGMGLQERQVGLQERDYEDSKSRANREFALRRIERVEGMLKDRRSLTPGQIEKMERELDKHYSAYPDLDMRAKDAPPQTPPTNDAPPTVQPELYNIPQQSQAPPPLPFDADFGVGGMSQGPAQFDPEGIRPSMPDRPIPNTGQGVIGSQNAGIAGPPSPFPAAPPQPTQQGPTQAQAQPPPKTFSAREYWLSRATNQALSEADREMAMAQLQKLDSDEATLANTRADTGYKQEMTRQIAPNAALARAAQLEEIAMSRYKRLEYMPAELQAIIAKAKAGQALDPSDLIALQRLNFDIEKLKLDRQDAASDRTWDRTKDTAEFDQRERIAGGQQTAQAEGQVRAATLKVIQQEVTSIDPVTRMPKLKPGGLKRFQQLVSQMRGEGQTVNSNDYNPGFDERIWGAVQQPGFNVNAAIAAARAQGNTQAAQQIKAAAAMYGKMSQAETGGSVSQPAPAKPSPAPKGRTGYGAGGLMGPRR
jgi:hypothetical protein